MSVFETLVVAVGLAIDAFAVSVSAGAGKRIRNHRGAFRLAFHFGLFQFIMPVIGWFAGYALEPMLRNFDHWIAFILLGYVGVKMIRDSFEEMHQLPCDPSRGKYLVMLSIATSIDAMAVGFSISMLNLEIWHPSVLIGAVTAFLSITGIYFGKFLGTRFGKKMELVGGLVLITIGLKILLTHLFS